MCGDGPVMQRKRKSWRNIENFIFPVGLLNLKSSQTQPFMSSSSSHEEDNAVVKVPGLVRVSSKRPKALQEIIRIKNHQINHPNYSHANGSIGGKAGLYLRKLSRPSHCEICEEETPINQKMFIADCEHKDIFCQSCLQHYAVYTIQQFGKVHCPSRGCERELKTDSAFFASLPAAVQVKYKRLLRLYQTHTDPSIRLCPRQACEGILRPGESTLRCNMCHGEFCKKCLLSTHEGDCDALELQFFEETLRYRRCSKCHAYIDKFEGCNHRVCICKHQFCYVCGADWHKDHYNNHDQNGNFVPLARQGPNDNIGPLNVPNAQEQSGGCCCYRKPDCFYYATILPRSILFLILICLLIALFPVLVVVIMLGAALTAKRKNMSRPDTATERQMKRNTDSCFEDMCNKYFQSYGIIADKLLCP